MADDTKYLSDLLTSDARRVRIPNRGEPYRTRQLSVRGPKEVIFEAGTVVEGIAEAYTANGACVLNILDQAHVAIRGNGARLKMECAEYSKALQQRHVIKMRGHDITIQDLDLSGAGGDGIYVGAGCSDVTIRGSHCHANGRQGISVIGCNGLLIDDCVLEDTFGDWPGAGLDFEPNNPGEGLLRCVVRNTVIRGNAKFGLLINVDRLDESSAPVDIEVCDCVIDQPDVGSEAVRVMAERSRPDGLLWLRNVQATGRSRYYLTDRFRVEA